MTSVDAGTLGDVFNARDLSSRDVAKGFIAPAQFHRLLSDAHCVLEGPRGSGKTTLLRMLTPEAFALWSDGYVESINFIGVFVPADVRWAKQLSMRLDLVGDVIAREAVQQAVFSVAVSLALVDTIERSGQLMPVHGHAHPALFFEMTREREHAIVSALSQLWGIDVSVKSFSGMRLSLRLRQHALGGVALSLATGVSLSELQSGHAYIASSWLDNVVTGVETVNDILDRKDQRWAILLDELEIIPSGLLKTIVDALRSTSERLRLKLALSPTGSTLISTGEAGAATPGNDYRSIPLWYANREDARKFSQVLFKAALVRMRCIGDAEDLSEALGPSAVLETSNEDETEADAADTETEADRRDELPVDSTVAQRERSMAFASLYEKDESFKALIDEKKIDLKNLSIKDSAARGTLIRKITPLVILRNREIVKFAHSAGRSQRKGGQRSLQSYIGWPNLIDLTEGNPRWILTLAEALKARASEQGLTIVARGVQTNSVDEYVRQFVSKLTVYPTKGMGPDRHWTPFKFIAVLGKHLGETLYDRAFVTDPSLSFTIDEHALQQYGEYIRVCIDLGALVIMRGGSAAPLSSSTAGQSLIGNRVRISYRLAPEFRLPLRATKEQTMSGAMRSGELLPDRSDIRADAVQGNADAGAAIYTVQEKLL